MTETELIKFIVDNRDHIISDFKKSIRRILSKSYIIDQDIVDGVFSEMLISFVDKIRNGKSYNNTTEVLRMFKRSCWYHFRDQALKGKNQKKKFCIVDYKEGVHPESDVELLTISDIEYVAIFDYITHHFSFLESAIFKAYILNPKTSFTKLSIMTGYSTSKIYNLYNTVARHMRGITLETVMKWHYSKSNRQT